MTQNDYQTIQAIAEATIQRCLEAAGLTSGMISEREGIQRYGYWFKQAVKDGRILPARIGTGRSDAKNCTRRYQLSDILNLIAKEKAQAQAQAQLIS